MKSWQHETFVGFDVETSGPYPLSGEICEIAAVKWKDGKIKETFQSLVSVKKTMSDEVIKIHNITNEMLVDAPPIGEVIKKFCDFVEDSITIAHHAPFDLGFITPEIEKLRLPLPKQKALCSSLLSRKAFPESENHKLQTLIKFFKFKQGQAHRALDDAKACLEVGLQVFLRLGEKQTIDYIYTYQKANLAWTNYSLVSLKQNTAYAQIIKAIESNMQVQITYSGGSRPGQPRTVTPLGLVRNPLDDYLVARENANEIPKRYFLNKITAASL